MIGSSNRVPAPRLTARSLASAFAFLGFVLPACGQQPFQTLLVSEFGAEAKYGNHGADNQRWTEEQQANVYNHQFVMLGKIPQLRGMTPWVLADFRSNTRNIPRLQDGYNRKGLVSEDGKKKQAFFVLQQAYKDNSIGRAE